MNTNAETQVMALLASIVEERTGIHYASRDLPLLADRVHTRCAEAGFASSLDYYYFLRYDAGADAEFRELVELLVVGETYLFRELEAIWAAVEHVIRPAVAARGRARVWSAGCSTGEEPFTLAMLLAHAGLLHAVDIVATDLSRRSIERAERGVVSRRSLRTLGSDAVNPSPDWVRRIAEEWLFTSPKGTAQVSRRIVGAIEFRQESLLAPRHSVEPGTLDLVICRNVLIYFDDEVIAQIVASLTESLRPGGQMLVGTTESLLRFGTALRCVEHGGAFFYLKP